MLLAIIGLIVLLILAYQAFVNFSPSFGGDVSSEMQKQYEKSPNYNKGKFYNEKKEVPEDMSFGQMLKLSRKFFFTKVPNGSPSKDLKVEKVDSVDIADYNGETRLIWFGHSTFLLQVDDKNVLLDPMFGNVPAPHPWLGSGRFSEELPIAIEKLPKIDAIVISHDHYDHLDYESIEKLKEKVDMFYTPLGVGVHLKKWGVEDNRIVELDWWEEVNHEGLLLACTPAQHFSGRKFGNRQSTLWSSWVIKSNSKNIFFSGDSGYGDHFKTIGAKYGPFDFAMMECGQYNENWADIHMMPEETAQASADLSAQTFMPIHWGAFKLALHSWTDPIERVSKKAKELQLPMIAPEIGASIVLDNLPQENIEWWER